MTNYAKKSSDSSDVLEAAKTAQRIIKLEKQLRETTDEKEKKFIKQRISNLKLYMTACREREEPRHDPEL